MPPKKAAAPVAGASGDTPAKAPAKAEKAAAPPVDDKKPKSQPKQEEKPQTQNNKGQEKTQDKPQGKGKGKQSEPEPEPVAETTTAPGRSDNRQYEPDDDVVREIKSRISEIEAEIQTHRDEIDQIRNTIETKKTSQTDLKKEQDEAKKKAQAVGDPKTFNDRYDQTVDSIQNLQKLQRAKAAEQKQMRQQLGGAAADQKDYGRQLDVDIRALQEKQASGEVGKLLDEKKLIAEIGKLTSNKKLYKTYSELNESIKQYETQITTLRAELDKIKDERNAYRNERKTFDDTIYASRDQYAANSSEIEKAITRRKELNDIVTELRKKVDACYDEIREHRGAIRDKLKSQRQEEQKKKQEERKQQAEERQKKEEERGSYADELEACTLLLQYLEPFKYRAPEVATEEPGEKEEKEKDEEGEKEEKEDKEDKEAPAASTPPPGRRGGKKKQPAGETDKEKELKHSAQTFFQFETLSLVAPQKVGDVEGALSQISEKKEFYQKREAEKKGKRKTNGTKDE